MSVLMIIGAAGAVAIAAVGIVLARAYWRQRRLEREWKRFVMHPVRPLRRGRQRGYFRDFPIEGGPRR